jgi:GTP-binding protein
MWVFWRHSGTIPGDPNLRILQCSMTEPIRTAANPLDALSAEARLALAWAHSARFLTTASKLDQLPQGDLAEIAFVGRSNAGKSTAINALAQRRQLAFASKTPGRTQHINLFALGPKDGPDAHLADLPGYGYASVARTAKLRWQQVMADYLEVRRNLSGVVLLVDSRLGFTPLDQQLLSFIATRVGTGEIKLLVLLTKADKLNRAEQQASLNAAKEVLAELATDDADLGILLFSAPKHIGLGDLAEALYGWTRPKPPAAAEAEAEPGTPGPQA